MTLRPFISTSIRRLAISLALLMASTAASAQMKFFTMQKDSVPLFRGFAVSFDLVGVGMLMFSDRGQYEAALRINLHDEWFPILEAGIGKANSDDEMTRIHYSTSAPYFKLGIDRNLLKDKHGPNRLYVCLSVYAMPLPTIRLISRAQISPILTGSGIQALASRMRPVNCTGWRR